MATVSQVKAGLNDVATEIRQARMEATRCKISIANLNTALGNLATKYADVISTINAYTPTNAFETLSKDELAKLTTEFQALRTDIASAQTSLDSLTEF